SSMQRAAIITGLGAGSVRIIEVDDQQAMSVPALRSAIETDRAAGARPVLVCATIGTTSTGAADPLAAIAELATPLGMWLHVDAAWAGVTALCPELREPFAGLERADSFCTDAHKWLLTAFDCSLFFIADRASLIGALSILPEYLRNAATETGAVTDYRDWQLPLGRRFRALKLWTVLRWFGLEGLREHLRNHLRLTAELAERIRAMPGFGLGTEPRFGLLTLYRDTGEGPEADNAATRALLAACNAEGSVFLTHTVLDGRYLIRVAIGGTATTIEHIDTLCRTMQALG
ncbi:MAG: pyridoxal phosphate-dependent decarboxylase family protein, partial [Sciscionella sp.]